MAWASADGRRGGEGWSMHEHPRGAMAAVNSSVAHPARVHSAWLGGRDNYLADQEAAANARIVPAVRANRAFLGRAVRELAGKAGIRQFLDVGTGIPTADNTHEVAQRVDPGVRVVYVDNDPIVLAHARALLISTPSQYPRGRHRLSPGRPARAPPHPHGRPGDPRSVAARRPHAGRGPPVRPGS